MQPIAQSTTGVFVVTSYSLWFFFVYLHSELKTKDNETLFDSPFPPADAETTAAQDWRNPGAESKTCAKRLNAERLNLIVINAVVPMLFAYGCNKGKEVYCDRAFDIIEQCKSEKNAITKHWEQYDIKANSAVIKRPTISRQQGTRRFPSGQFPVHHAVTSSVHLQSQFS